MFTIALVRRVGKRNTQEMYIFVNYKVLNKKI